jgi:hypothetical protein
MRILGPVLLLVVLAGCAAGDGSEWAQEGASPAGLFAGFWHGMLLLVTLVVSFFTADVGIYEVVNTGVSYDIGFVLGVFAVYGSGCSMTCGRKKKPSDDLGDQIERKIKAKVERFIEEDEDEWKEPGDKVEKKIKAKLRRWLDED